MVFQWQRAPSEQHQGRQFFEQIEQNYLQKITGRILCQQAALPVGKGNIAKIGQLGCDSDQNVHWYWQDRASSSKYQEMRFVKTDGRRKFVPAVKAFPQNIARIAKAASHKLPGRSSFPVPSRPDLTLAVTPFSCMIWEEVQNLPQLCKFLVDSKFDKNHFRTQHHQAFFSLRGLLRIEAIFS